jgi:hypothetical protein
MNRQGRDAQPSEGIDIARSAPNTNRSLLRGAKLVGYLGASQTCSHASGLVNHDPEQTPLCD